MEIGNNNFQRFKISSILTHHIYIENKQLFISYYRSLFEVETIDVIDKYLLTLFQDNKEVVVHQLYLLYNFTLLCIEHYPSQKLLLFVQVQ